MFSMPYYHVFLNNNIKMSAYAGLYADFRKGVCEFKSFYKGGANLKKILIFRPKLGV